MKKFLTLLIVICLCIGTQAVASASSFDDIVGLTHINQEDLPDIKYDQIPDSTLQKMKELFGLSAKIDAVEIYNDNNNIVYCVFINDEKTGWYLLKDGKILEKFNSDEHRYLFMKPSKISADLQKILDSANNDQLIPVYIITEDVDHSLVDLFLSENHPVAYEKKLKQDKGEKLTVKDTQDVIDAKRKVYSDMYTEKNNSILSKYLTKKSKKVLISQYSQLNILYLDKENIEQISKDNEVISIFPYVQEKIVPLVVEATKAIQGDYVRDTLGYNGTGVKIGQIEPTCPDNGNSELDSQNIIYRYSNPSTDNHATAVATIMVGDTLGISPASTVYSTYASSGSTFYNEIEWLIMQGVNVINMSAGLYSNGSYDTYAQWIDHLAKVHSVHFVMAAGNEGNNGYVKSPGTAYNIITVGGFNDNGSGTNHTDDTLCTFSSAVEASSIAEKPDLIAPAEDIDFTNIYVFPFSHYTDSGTSFAAPMTSAVIAQMIDVNPALATKQVAMKAILLASAFRKIPGFTGISASTPYIDDIQGAGKLDSKNARYIVSNNRYYSNTLIKDADFSTTFSVNASSSQIRVALTWLKQNSITNSHIDPANLTQTPIADYDLYVYAPNGALVGKSVSSTGNVEIVEFDPTTTGSYRIVVRYFNGTADRETIALAWW